MSEDPRRLDELTVAGIGKYVTLNVNRNPFRLCVPRV